MASNGAAIGTDNLPQPVNDVPIQRTALEEELYQKRAKIARQIQDLGARERVHKLRETKEKHQAQPAEYVKSMLEDIDIIVADSGTQSSDATGLQEVLASYGLEHDKLQQDIEMLLEGSLDAYYAAHICDELKDLDTDTRLARLSDEDFPLHSQLLDSYQSRLAVYRKIHPSEYHPVGNAKKVTATEIERLVQVAKQEYFAFQEMIKALYMVEQFHVGQADELRRKMTCYLFAASGQSSRDTLRPISLDEFRMALKLLWSTLKLRTFLKKYGNNNSKATSELCKTTNQLLILRHDLPILLGEILVANPQIQVPGLREGLDDMMRYRRA